MKLLFDTNALLWLIAGSERLSPAARDAAADAGNPLFTSAGSLLEIAIKRSIGKLDVPDDLPSRLPSLGCDVLPVSAAHAWRVGDLPLLHKDPFDRLIVAQALEEDMILVTSDAVLARYGVPVLAA